MEIITHNVNNVNIAELISADVIVNDTEAGLDLLGNLFHGGFDRVIIHEKNITPEFFDLKSGLQAKFFKTFLIIGCVWL